MAVATKELSDMSDTFVPVEMSLFCYMYFCWIKFKEVVFSDCQQVRADLVTEERGIKDSRPAETLSVWG